MGRRSPSPRRSTAACGGRPAGPMSRRRCLAALAAPLLWGWRSASAATARPNILFVMIDTLRADHVGCYGYTRPTTPRIDRLARQSVRFANLYTAGPWTMPSVMTMFTSLHPSVHGAVSFQRRASLKVTTLAERLKRLGYRRTAAITSNPTVNSRYGFAQGFDTYDDYSVFFAHELGLFGVDDAPQRKSVVEAVTSKTVTDLAGRWLEKEGRRGPWLLFLLYFDPHLDYVPKPPWDRRFDPHPTAESRKTKPNVRHLTRDDAAPGLREHLLALYDGEIGYTDLWLGKLLDRLDALGHADDTLVLLTSDHGEEFLDHGGILHGRTLYAEQTRGILLLRHPDRLPAGKTVTAPARHVDLTPTLLDHIGAPPDPECQGASLLPLIGGGSGGASPDDRPSFLEGTAGTHLRAIVRGRHKLIRDLDTGTHQLYDLAADPAEKTDLADRRPKLLADLRAQLDAHIAACDAAAKHYQVGGTTPRPKLTKRDLHTLRQLGYIQ